MDDVQKASMHLHWDCFFLFFFLSYGGPVDSEGVVTKTFLWVLVSEEFQTDV